VGSVVVCGGNFTAPSILNTYMNTWDVTINIPYFA